MSIFVNEVFSLNLLIIQLERTKETAKVRVFCRTKERLSIEDFILQWKTLVLTMEASCWRMFSSMMCCAD